MTPTKQRYRTIGTEWRGWMIALIEDRESGNVLRVYRHLGRWRLRGTDDVAPRGAAACAKRALEHADIDEAHAQFRARVAATIEELGTNGNGKRRKQ